MRKSSLGWVAPLFVVSASALAAGPAYPLKVSDNARYLVDQRGAPFLIQGDAPWSLIVGLTREEATQYLEDRRARGFNSLLVNLIEHKFKGPRNRYGEEPFARPGDFLAPNEAYFAHADWVIRKAGEMGIQILLTPMYLGYQGSDEGWIEEVLANGPARCREYGRYLGRRYRDFPNILWVMGGDRDPDESRAEVGALAEGIREFDSRHLFTAHCAPEHSAVEEYPREDWLGLNTTYTYQLVHPKLLQDYSRRPVRPFVLIESSYEGEHNSTPLQIRRQAYWAILSGAAGQVMGNRPIWLFDPGWQKALDSPGSVDMSHLWKFFNSRRWYDLLPDREHKVVTEGLGEFNGLDYLAAARASDGSAVVVYLPSRRAVTVDLSQISRREVKAAWFDPRTGQEFPAGQFPATGSRYFTPPADGDWVLVLDASP